MTREQIPMEPEKCGLFMCYRRVGHYCCTHCQLQDKCSNPCMNGPERCGYFGKEVKTE